MLEGIEADLEELKPEDAETGPAWSIKSYGDEGVPWSSALQVEHVDIVEAELYLLNKFSKAVDLIIICFPHCIEIRLKRQLALRSIPLAMAPKHCE